MDKNIQEQLESIKDQIPDSVDLYDVERKLDKLIELQERQIEVSEQILNKLDDIYNDIPGGSNLDTVEAKLDRLIVHIDTSNDHLSDISGHTSNIS